MAHIRDFVRVATGLLLAALLLSGLTAPAQAAFPPRPTGPVYDGADMLPAADEAALVARLREFNQRTGNAVIVATIPSLEGDSIESYSTHLFETWGIGGKERDAGVLLIIAKNDKRIRIEVGYGLHPYITDILSGRIIRNEITPRFKSGDFPGGIKAGVDQITAQLERSPLDAKAVAEAAAAAERNRQSSSGGGWIGNLVFWGFLIFVLLLVFRSRRRWGRRKYGDGIDLWEIGEVAANVAANVAINAVFDGDGGGGDSDGGFGGFGGGMSGGGGASGDW